MHRGVLLRLRHAARTQHEVGESFPGGARDVSWLHLFAAETHLFVAGREVVSGALAFTATSVVEGFLRPTTKQEQFFCAGRANRPLIDTGAVLCFLLALERWYMRTCSKVTVRYGA